MRTETAKTIADIIRPESDVPLWQWAADNIVYAQPYPAMEFGPFDPKLAPFFREPMERAGDLTTREIWLIKPPQIGASEHLLLTPMRHKIAEDPGAILYISGDQKSTEEFIEERIKQGLRLSPVLRKKLAEAREREHQIYYKDGLLVMGWNRSAGIAKQRAADMILCDEVDIWDEFVIDQLRGRFETRPFTKLIGVSSLDPKRRATRKDSPIWIEFKDTDRRFYYLPEPEHRNPKTRKYFVMVMGCSDRKTGKECPWGVKWSPDAQKSKGVWDIAAAVDSAHYKTPEGAIIDDDLKRELLEDGKWIPTVRGADPTKWGGHLNHLYAPWKTFGEVARGWLEATRKKDRTGDTQALKVEIMEKLGEDFWDKKQSIEDDVIYDRQGQYEKGSRITLSDGEHAPSGELLKKFYIKQKTMVLLTADVQKGYGWYVAREWVLNGDSGLIDYGAWTTWAELNKRATELKAKHVLVDSAYGDRTQETYEACWQYKFVPTQGKENIPDLLYRLKDINPFAGSNDPKTKRKRGKITLMLFRTDPMKSQLMLRIRGETEFGWYVYDNIEETYVHQVTSEERIEGVWVPVGGANHLWDCEVLQLLGATHWGFNRFRGFAGRQRP